MNKIIRYLAATVLLAAPLVPAWGQLLNSPKNKIKILGKPETFGVEKISRIRSQTIRPERGSLVVYGDMLVVASAREVIAVFNSSGQRQMQLKLDFSPISTPAVQGGLLFVGGDDGRFHCIRLSDGNEVWSHDRMSIDYSPPALTDSAVIFQTASDLVMALDPQTGKWLWEHQHLRFEDLALMGLAAPVVSNGVAYVGLSGGAVAALDAKSGRLIWKKRVFEGEQFMDIDSPVLVGGNAVYAVSAGGRMASLSISSGKVFWTYEVGGLGGASMSGDRIFVSTDEAEIVAMDAVSGRPAWTADLAKGEQTKFLDLYTRPLPVGDYLVAVSRSGKVVVMDKGSGEVLDKRNYRTDTTSPATAVGDDGFAVIDNRGVVRLWRLGG